MQSDVREAGIPSSSSPTSSRCLRARSCETAITRRRTSRNAYTRFGTIAESSEANMLWDSRLPRRSRPQEQHDIGVVRRLEQSRNDRESLITFLTITVSLWRHEPIQAALIRSLSRPTAPSCFLFCGDGLSTQSLPPPFSFCSYRSQSSLNMILHLHQVINVAMR